MTTRSALHLHEEILLLALQDKQGTVVSGTWYSYALAGALLSELVLAGRIRPVGEKNELEVVSRETLGEPLLDECLELLRESAKRKPMAKWLATVANWKELKDRAAQGLCRRGILRSDTEKVLLFFERRVYPEVDPAPERAVIERLQRAIFDDGDDIDARTVVLLSLAFQTNILKAVFDPRDLKKRKERVERVINGEATGKAAKQVLADVQAAMFITTVIIPAVIVPTIIR